MSTKSQEKPLVCTYRQLAFALRRLHAWQPPLLADLHDVWLKGAPTPDSRVQKPQGYDPRKLQAGNLEKRIVLPSLLAKYIEETGKRKGIPMTLADARKLVTAIKKGWDQT